MSVHLHSRLALAALMSAAVMSGCGADDEPSSVVTATTTATEPAATPTPMPTTTAAPAPTATTAPAPTATTKSGASGDPTASLSREQAISIARRRYPGGRVRQVERDDEDGLAVWKVKIRTTRTTERELSIAIDGGRIVKIQAEEIDPNEDDVDD